MKRKKDHKVRTFLNRLELWEVCFFNNIIVSRMFLITLRLVKKKNRKKFIAFVTN